MSITNKLVVVISKKEDPDRDRVGYEVTIGADTLINDISDIYKLIFECDAYDNGLAVSCLSNHEIIYDKPNNLKIYHLGCLDCLTQTQFDQLVSILGLVVLNRYGQLNYI